MFKISRIWNRMAFKIMDLGHYMIWDYTKKNQDIIKDFKVGHWREMLTKF